MTTIESSGSIIDRLFPIDGSEDPDADLRLGYDDVSDDLEATQLLKALPAEVVAVIHKNEFNDLFSPFEVLEYLRVLISGIDKRDPEHRSQGAIELALEELESCRELMAVFAEYTEIPYLVFIGDDSGTFEDAATRGWGLLYIAPGDNEYAKEHLATIDIMEAYLKDSRTGGAYSEARSSYNGDWIIKTHKELLGD